MTNQQVTANSASPPVSSLGTGMRGKDTPSFLREDAARLGASKRLRPVCLLGRLHEPDRLGVSRVLAAHQAPCPAPGGAIPRPFPKGDTMTDTVTEPVLEIHRVLNPRGYAVVIDGHVERFETSLYAAESFMRGVEWAGREFGWASDRLRTYGRLASSALVTTPRV